MTKRLKLGADISLPTEAVTETFGILAVRGAGKSNTAAVMAEEMFAAGLPFVVVDPVGSWWGLRSNAAGDGPGLPIPLFGGKRGDVPLERTGGSLVADLVVDQRLSCVLDLSTFDSESAKKAFLLDFARRLYLRNTEPLHLFLEEADDYIPQRPMRDEPELLRAWENIVRRGRSRGLGMTLITQRSASLNKNVLTQVQTLIAMRTTGPQDRAAIEEWVKYHDQSRDILASLSGLGDGEAWVWSPEFLKKTVRVQFRQRQTYDSGATPKLSKGARPTATLADVDLASIQQRMTATIERAKQEDPKELRRRIAELEKAAKVRTPVNPLTPSVKTEIREVPVLSDVERAELEKLSAQLVEVKETIGGAEEIIRQAKADFGAALDEFHTTFQRALRPKLEALSRPRGPVPPPQTRSENRTPAGRKPMSINRSGFLRAADALEGLGAVHQKVLNALAELDVLGIARPPRIQVAFLSGYSNLNSTGFAKAVGALRAAGLITYPDSQSLELTDTGRAGASVPDVPRSPDEIQGRILEMLGGVHARVLRPLIDAYPDSVGRMDLAKAAGYSNLNSTGFAKAVGRLRSLGLLTYPDSHSALAAPVLFLEGSAR